MSELILRGVHNLRKSPDVMASVWMLIVIIPLGVALADIAQLNSVLSIAIGAFGGTLPYITVAVLLIAYLKAAGAESIVARAFVGRESRMIVLAALFGGLAPFCSCEVIPFIAGLLALGTAVRLTERCWL